MVGDKFFLITDDKGCEHLMVLKEVLVPANGQPGPAIPPEIIQWAHNTQHKQEEHFGSLRIRKL